MITVRRIGEHNVGVIDVSDIIEKRYREPRRNISRLPWIGHVPITKAQGDNQKVLSAPYSMAKLLDLPDTDGWHSGCIDAISSCTVMQFRCKDKRVSDWLKSAQYPGNESGASILSEMIRFYIGCGNK